MTGLRTLTRCSPRPPPPGPPALATGRKPAHRLLTSGSGPPHSQPERVLIRDERKEPSPETGHRLRDRWVKEWPRMLLGHLSTMRTFHETQKAVASKKRAGGRREPGGRVPPAPLRRSSGTASLRKGRADARCAMVRPTHMLNLPSSRLLRMTTVGTTRGGKALAEGNLGRVGPQAETLGRF